MGGTSLFPPILYNSIKSVADVAVTRVSPHVLLKFQMRIVILIDFINEFKHGVRFEGLGHILIVA
jgi:hypothetical protein